MRTSTVSSVFARTSNTFNLVCDELGIHKSCYPILIISLRPTSFYLTSSYLLTSNHIPSYLNSSYLIFYCHLIPSILTTNTSSPAAVHPENRHGAEDACNAKIPGIDRLSASCGSDQFSGEEGFSSRTTQVE